LKFLLDENFPLPLLRRLRAEGLEVEHIIDLGQRGLPDAVIRRRIANEGIVLLTQDTEFEDWPAEERGKVIISRVPQSVPIQIRVELWSRAVRDFVAREPSGNLFEILETGELVQWESHDLG
jgi:predicted nuclease of predicted toxin-antitoxin system